LRLVLDVEVKAGNEHSSAHSAPALWGLLDRLGRDRWPWLLRGDADFGTERIMSRAEQEGMPYLFKLRSTRNVKRLIEKAMGEVDWIAFVTGPMNTFLFVYAENALGMSRSTTAAMVVLGAGPIGLVGLLIGRWAADRLGRRVTAAGTQATVALAGMLTYSGSRPAVVAGYLLAILGASAYAPSFGALGSELFPTSVRATVAGWLVAAGVVGAVAGLVAFGLLTDALDSFATAAVLVCAPVVLTCVLFARLPETRGLELEQSAPD
jgi:hypothetical protein